MIPVDGSFPNLLEWPSLLALEAGGEQARGCCQSRAQCCGTLAGSPPSLPRTSSCSWGWHPKHAVCLMKTAKKPLNLGGFQREFGSNRESFMSSQFGALNYLEVWGRRDRGLRERNSFLEAEKQHHDQSLLKFKEFCFNTRKYCFNQYPCQKKKKKSSIKPSFRVGPINLFR